MSETVAIPEYERTRNGKAQTVPEHERKGVTLRWPKPKIIEAILLWNDLFGEPPRFADWSPAMARQLKRRHGTDHRTAAYLAGHWPSAATVSRVFGTWTAAIVAAGVRPHPTGPRLQRPASDAVEQARSEYRITPNLLLGRVRAVLDAYRAGDTDALRSALTDTSSAALAWREQVT